MRVVAPTMWHVYGANVELTGGAKVWYTLVIKPNTPQEMPKVWNTDDALGLALKVPLPHLQSFDHDPSDEEMEILREQFDKS